MCQRWIVCCSALIALVVIGASSAKAGGPRFITGTSGWFDSGWPIAFYTSSPAYYTDPGDLNSAVTHAQADAMVAAAASVWNVPTASLVLTQGGMLNEHVSSANTYFDGTQIVFPSDVSASNWQSKQIAVIYDTDGSVIDTLLGYGASNPSGCRQTGVVESVDSFGWNGKIQHAMLILNGRCVGQNAQQLQQMQYQLERAFGRVLGLSWSQLNDNIFTGATPPTANQLAYWPIMHPIDVLCGPYSYQCLTNPFQLRADDLSTLAYLYPVTSSNITTGKTLSATNAVYLEGHVLFPTGQGMAWVNVTVARQLAGHGQLETWQTASGITGAMYHQNVGNPVTGSEPAAANAGTPWTPAEERAIIQRVPNDYLSNLYLSTEAINPLYTAEYALGPYQRPPVAPSGSPVTMVDWSARASSGGGYSQTVWDAPATCPSGNDGTQGQPAPSDSSGWWNGLLCSWGHTSWWSIATKPGRSWTFEVTALNESGAPTNNKVQPVIGVWNAGDSGLPTVASATVPMNSMALGVTQLQITAGNNAASYTVAVADRYGAGRPDFAYRARMLYADTVSPQSVSAAGAQITITGEGFRQGNQVLVNSAPATVISVTANQIVARVPAMSAAGAALGQPVNLTVRDTATGGQTTISSALSYSNVDIVKLVSAPASLETGVPSSTSFAVRVYAADGVTPVQGASVSFAVQAGLAVFGACSSAGTCTLQTDATGLAQTTVTGGASGAVTLIATEVSGGGSQQVSIVDADPVRSVRMITSPSYVAADAALANVVPSWTLSVAALQDGVPATGLPVTWSTSQALTFDKTTTVTDASGTATASVRAGQLSAGAFTVTACAWGSVCTTWTAYAVDPAEWRIIVVTGAGQSVRVGGALGPVTVRVTDAAGHPLPGAGVSIYQTADGWEGVCAAQGRCPASPILRASESTAVADADGLSTVTPLQVPGQPQTVNIAAVTGTQGFVSLSLVLTP